MHIKPLAVAAALLGLAAFTVNAAEIKVVNSTQGRSGMRPVFLQKVQRPTVALSKQGQGVGTKSDQNRTPKAQWYNPSRSYGSVTAHN